MVDNNKNTEQAEVLAKIEKRAYELENTVHGCSQCTILALQEAFNLEDEMLFKAVGGLGFGIARMYSVCGALLAGCIFLGVKYGRTYSDLEKPQSESLGILRAANEPIGRLYKWFEREFGHVTCRELRKKFLGVDLDPNVPWQMEMAIDLGLGKHCCQLVAKVTRRTAELMMELPERAKDPER